MCCVTTVAWSKWRTLLRCGVRCWICSWLWSWTTSTTWHVIHPYSVLTTSTSTSESGPSTIQPPRMFLNTILCLPPFLPFSLLRRQLRSVLRLCSFEPYDMYLPQDGYPRMTTVPSLLLVRRPASLSHTVYVIHHCSLTLATANSKHFCFQITIAIKPNRYYSNNYY